MLLSIITITYNDLSGLRETIESIDKSFYYYEGMGVVEHVIVDGSSTDGTIAYLNQVIGFRKVQTNYKVEHDEGIYDAMNKGVMRSSGQFVVFLNAGDKICSSTGIDKLFTSLESISSLHNAAGLALSSYIKFARKSFKINSREVQKLLPRMPTVHQSMFYKRSILLGLPFNISYMICGDYENFARIFSSGLIFRSSDDIFSVFYAGGISSKSPIRLFLESTDITKKYFGLNLPRRILIMSKLFFSLTRFKLLLLFYGVPKQN